MFKCSLNETVSHGIIKRMLIWIGDLHRTILKRQICSSGILNDHMAYFCLPDSKIQRLTTKDGAGLFS